ncbi:MAG: hypothetical protein QM638_14925 [Nocardioides sp.]|uniref:hypothetical protein n=1 Tax=Nocardioides sp. TaxID=35761 RepID=UPI0039E35BD1
MSDPTRSYDAPPPVSPAAEDEPAPGSGGPSRSRGGHRVNIGHLVMGVVFLVFAVDWILIDTDTVTGSDVHWLLPIPWVIGGAVGLLAAAVASSRRRR